MLNPGQQTRRAYLVVTKNFYTFYSVHLCEKFFLNENNIKYNQVCSYFFLYICLVLYINKLDRAPRSAIMRFFTQILWEHGILFAMYNYMQCDYIILRRVVLYYVVLCYVISFSIKYSH